MMKLKKTLSLMMAMAMSLTLVCCAQETTTPASGTADVAGDTGTAAAGNDSGLVIGFAQDQNDIEWTQLMKDDIQAACDENGVTLTVTDANGSGEKAVSDLEDLITLGVDAIIVQTYHADVIATAVRDALDAGIPVIAISSEIPGVDVTSLLTVDAMEIGRTIARYIVDQYPDGGNIVQITGKEGSLVNVNRGLGFREIIDADDRFTVLAELSCNYERSLALTTMEDQLQAHGSSIDIVYSHNDDMALGIIQAIEDMGYVADINDGIFVASAADGMIVEVLDNVENGKMTSGYFPTFGREGVDAALKAINGEDLDSTIFVECEIITQTNVAEYRR